MRWYASVQGQTYGPLEEHQVLELVAAGRLEYVRGEGGGAWLRVHESPFAGYAQGLGPTAPQVASANYTPPVATHGPQRPGRKPSSSAPQWLFVAGACLGALLSSALGWLGIALGLGLIAWTIQRHRKGRRSLLAIAWSKPLGLITTGGTVAVGLLFSTCGTSSLLAQREIAAKRERQAEQERAQAEAEVAAKVKQRADLEKTLPSTIAGWQGKLTEALGVADKTTAAEGRALTKLVQEEIAAHSQKMGQPTPASLAALEKQSSEQYDRLAARAALSQSLKTVDAEMAAGKTATKRQAWSVADAAYESALSAIGAIEKIPADVKRYVPGEFDTAAKRGEVEVLRKAIAGPLAQEKKRVEREEQLRRAREEKEEAKRKAQEAKDAAYAAMCGEKPLVGGWDGEVVGLESTLKEALRRMAGPKCGIDDLDVENCSDPKLYDRDCWEFSCDIKKPNCFGVEVTERMTLTHSKALGFRVVQ